MRSFYQAAFLLFFLPAAFFGQAVNNPPTIVVSGVADMMVQPDEVAISLDVTKTNKDLQTAKRENDEAVSKILELTRTLKIAPEHVRTDHISVDMKYQTLRDPKNPVYDDDGDVIGKREFVGYEVSTTVAVRLIDIKRFEAFFSEVLKTGLSEVNSVTFQSSKLREHRDKAREMAMKAAHEKASAMARAIDQTIGKAISIAEVDTAGCSNYSNVTANTVGTIASTSEALATFSPGAIKISSQVNVTFLLN